MSTVEEIRTAIPKLSVEEKLQTMETLWQSLSSNPETLESPAWHEKELRDRERNIESGESTQKQINFAAIDCRVILFIMSTATDKLLSEFEALPVEEKQQFVEEVINHLRPGRAGRPKLSWEETAKAMAATKEDWSEWDSTAADGLNGL